MDRDAALQAAFSTTVPVLAKGKTDTGRCWVYVRDDRPFGGPAPPAAMFYYSRDRSGEHRAINLRGTIMACKHVLPIMRLQRSGAIINISSVAARENSYPLVSAERGARSELHRHQASIPAAPAATAARCGG